ncbi:MAG: hypothetical protein IT281_08295 [Ignavibacteria bacterium]|nr:hypothetical protein [Ignavibacteria bacterium]
MNNLELIATNAIDNLGANTPVKGKWKAYARGNAGGVLQLNYNKKNYPFAVELKEILRHDHIAALVKKTKATEPLLVIAANIPAGVKKALQEKQINYLEANGNAFIRNGDMLIFIDGRNPAELEKITVNRAFMKTGLKAVFHLLNHPQAVNDNYRKLAADTNIALGNIKYIMDGLYEAGFVFDVDKKNIRLKNMAGLLERWLVGYREILRPTLLLGTYAFNKANNTQNEWKQLDMKKADCLWGGEPAADILTSYLRPERFQLYTPQHKMQVVRALQLLPDAKGEIELYQQFWNGQHYQYFKNCVPPLLVYTDLLLTDDPRCAEAAQLIYDQYLKENVEAYQ